MSHGGNFNWYMKALKESFSCLLMVWNMQSVHNYIELFWLFLRSWETYFVCLVKKKKYPGSFTKKMLLRFSLINAVFATGFSGTRIYYRMYPSLRNFFSPPIYCCLLCFISKKALKYFGCSITHTFLQLLAGTVLKGNWLFAVSSKRSRHWSVPELRFLRVTNNWQGQLSSGVLVLSVM